MDFLGPLFRGSCPQNENLQCRQCQNGNFPRILLNETVLKVASALFQHGDFLFCAKVRKSVFKKQQLCSVLVTTESCNIHSVTIQLRTGNADSHFSLYHFHFVKIF